MLDTDVGRVQSGRFGPDPSDRPRVNAGSYRHGPRALVGPTAPDLPVVQEVAPRLTVEPVLVILRFRVSPWQRFTLMIRSSGSSSCTSPSGVRTTRTSARRS